MVKKKNKIETVCVCEVKLGICFCCKTVILLPVPSVCYRKRKKNICAAQYYNTQTWGRTYIVGAQYIKTFVFNIIVRLRLVSKTKFFALNF